MEEHEKEVYFYIYCPSCKYFDLNGGKEPCNECLGTPSQQDSHKPACYVNNGTDESQV